MSSQKQIDQIWDKGHVVRGKNPDTWRKDDEGNLLRKSSYGTLGDYGWEIDHKNPKANGGSDNMRNLRPLHWEENREKSDKT